MAHASFVPGDLPRHHGLRRRRGQLPLAAALATMLAAVIVGNRQDRVPASPEAAAARQAAVTIRAMAAAEPAYGWMLDRAPTPGAAAFAADASPPSGFDAKPSATAAITVEAVATPALLPAVALAAAEPSLPPLPVRRPAELMPAAPVARLAERTPSRRAQPVVVASNQVDGSSFFDRLFSQRSAPEQALAYASAGAPVAVPESRRLLAPIPSQDAAAGTAIYDISAGTVTLPGGDRLEAHSGLRQYFDDPRYVHLTMRGATPPGTYDLTEREALFHGVRAIRLTPVGGSGVIHGRVGLLAHTYMLGPRGDSNGCVSFRDYDRFLQAFLRGKVRRLVVVAGSGSPLAGSRYADAR